MSLVLTGMQLNFQWVFLTPVPSTRFKEQTKTTYQFATILFKLPDEGHVISLKSRIDECRDTMN